ncbi:RNA polymerase sigma factor [Demequina lutea]|uniref:RNA polymerase sigma-70 factor (ECF subfamily) n=1 Tax=Demequina lutea TaxID=431489 RepID=A0A7Y9ZCV0_9MICO|nr:RNA polymerase sigma factor [Demequina lutea]NYI42228.1 RNA polymerase sigma-70 factor (ECF subfamily) [Demequina lutea]
MNDVVPALDENAGALLNYLERRIGIDDAPDALAEVMTVVWRREGDLPADATEARMWMFGIAKGVLANAARGKVRRAKLAGRLRAVTAASDGAASATTPPADQGHDVRDAIARLDPELAEVVRLVHWDGFSLGEVAALEAIPASTVRSRYARAKRELAVALGIAAREPVVERA